MTTERRNKGISRRKFLRASAGTAALLAAAKAQLPSGAFAQAAGPEVKGAKLGFIALTDAGAAVRRQGEGLLRQVRRARHRSAEAGVVGRDARQHRSRRRRQRHRRRAHPHADALPDLGRQGDAEQRADADVHPGAAQSERPVHLGRQGICRPASVGLDTKEFKGALDKKKASGKAVKAANTFPGGTHDLWIRYWLAAGGIDPDKDIETITVPPPQMVANMKVGTMDCFCVCEPWNLQLIHQRHRLHRDHHRRALEQASGEVARHARCMRRQESEGRQGAC